jgi:hypothetical protein
MNLLRAAAEAADLHFEEPEVVRSTRDIVLSFNDSAGPSLRLLLNGFNLLPDAVETVTQFHDFWFYWGDVRR